MGRKKAKLKARAARAAAPAAAAAHASDVPATPHALGLLGSVYVGNELRPLAELGRGAKRSTRGKRKAR